VLLHCHIDDESPVHIIFSEPRSKLATVIRWSGNLSQAVAAKIFGVVHVILSVNAISILLNFSRKSVFFLNIITLSIHVEFSGSRREAVGALLNWLEERDNDLSSADS
jgi:hypothetical protein